MPTREYLSFKDVVLQRLGGNTKVWQRKAKIYEHHYIVRVVGTLKLLNHLESTGESKLSNFVCILLVYIFFLPTQKTISQRYLRDIWIPEYLIALVSFRYHWDIWLISSILLKGMIISPTIWYLSLYQSLDIFIRIENESFI